MKKKPEIKESSKRNQILHFADKMFMSQGFNMVSMDALAEAVPVSKRTLYDHFKDKRSLFTAVMQNRCKDFSSVLEQSVNDNRDVEKTLTEIGEKFLDVVLRPESVNMYRIAITESQQFPELGRLFFESGPQRIIEIISGYLKRMHNKGALTISKPDIAAKIFIGMLTNRIQMECMLGLRKNITRQEKTEIVETALEVFLHGYKARS